jgi:hypothetical protein
LKQIVPGDFTTSQLQGHDLKTIGEFAAALLAA